jgi:hypothetical protein
MVEFLHEKRCDRCGLPRNFVTYLTSNHEKICAVCRDKDINGTKEADAA